MRPATTKVEHQTEDLTDIDIPLRQSSQHAYLLNSIATAEN